MSPPEPDGTSPRENSYSRSACTECQRRKQKCNREWPCNHCQKRKVADKCRFNHANPTTERSTPESSRTRKRPLKRDSPPDGEGADEEEDDDADDFEALGYGSSHLFATINPDAQKKTKPAPKQYFRPVSSCPQLERALQVLPPRTYTDLLMTNFINNVNFHYYLIYPSSFWEEYRSWWDDRSKKRPLSVHWTCLFLVACACSVQYTTVELQHKLQFEMGESTQRLGEKYHNTARELSSIIPVGNTHLLSIQQLIHSCYWFKTEGRFVESWHVLTAVVREAQEIGIHRESITKNVPEFEREMRRRVWCVINTWDWQLSALLSRPMIIDRSECDVSLPSLRLEGYSPSPLLHMKLQSELIGNLSKRFGIPKNVTDPRDVHQYKQMIETWMRSFPPTFDLENPDRSMDVDKPWLKFHRHSLHTMSLSMALDPMRAYLAKPMTWKNPEAELQIRSDGVDYALRLMDALYGFFECVWPRDSTLHYVLFSIFDTAAVLCSAVLHDADLSIPRKGEILNAVTSALGMLERLQSETKMGKTSYKILLRLYQKLTRPLLNDSARKQPKAPETTLTPPFDGHVAKAPMSAGDSRFSDSGFNPTSPDNTLGDNGPDFYITPPNAAFVPDAPPMFAATSDAPIGGQMPSDVGMSDFTGAHDAAMMPSTSSHGIRAQDAGLLPTTYADMAPPGTDLYSDLYWGIPDQQAQSFAELWRCQMLDLTYVHPLMQPDTRQAFF